ncbi:hypothetical protein Q3C01_15120 [Bradyrhizobium sp. UFLA05-109]
MRREANLAPEPSESNKWIQTKGPAPMKLRVADEHVSDEARLTRSSQRIIPRRMKTILKKPTPLYAPIKN